jgi:hypothetical protein
MSFKFLGYLLRELYFLIDPPIFADVLYIARRQGGIDESLINSVNETIDSKGNIAKIRAGG